LKYSTTATILSAFNDALRVFKETVIELSTDEMMGLILQNNLRDHHRAAFDQRLELYMETHEY
jgi:hypothetical protein